jgi:hypothetical protein
VENGLRQVSEIAKGVGKRTFRLGNVTKPGFYHFKFVDTSGARVLVVPVLEEKGLASKAPPRMPPEDSAIEKFLVLHKRDLLLEAWRAWPAREEFAKKIVGITTVGTLGVACPFEGLSCGPAALGALDLALDFAFAFEEFFAEHSRTKSMLTDAELKLVKRVLLASKTAKSVLSIKGKWDAAISTVEFFTAIADNKDVQFSLGLMTDEVKKTRTLILLFKRP